MAGKVEYGGIYAVGPHRFSCMNIVDIAVGKVPGPWLPGEKAYIIYTDPPWNNGIVKVFNTWAENAGAEYIPPTFDEVIQSGVIVLQQASSRAVFVEMGLANVEMLVNLLESVGGQTHALLNVTYSSPPKPMRCWWGSFGFEDQMPHGESRPENPHGWHYGRWIVEKFGKSGEILFDPFMGLGGMAKLALEGGMVVRGNELNPDRLERTIAMVEKKLKEVRVRVG